MVKLEEFDTTVQKSQKYLFHIDPTCDRLVDSRGRTRVEHQLGRASRTVQRFGYPDLPANAHYRYLHPADVYLGDKWLEVGNVIKAQMSPPTRRKRTPAPCYRRTWGRTDWSSADRAALFTSAISNNTAIMSSDGSVKDGHWSTGWTIDIQT